MEILFEKLGKIVLTGAIAISSIFGGYSTAEAPKLGATIPTAVAVFQTSLNASIGANDTSMTLVSATDASGTTLASSTYGFVIDEGTASEEFVLANCTGVTCTGMIRGISPTTGNTSVTALKKAHRRNASVKITDSPLLLITTRILNGQESLPNKLYYDGTKTFSSSTEIITKGYADTEVASTTTYVNSLDVSNVKLTGSQTIAGVKTFSSSPIVPNPTNQNEAASKEYADNLVIAGGVIANNVVTGISRIASSTQIATGFASTTSFVIPSSLASSTASSTSIVVATKASTGKIDPTFLNGATEEYTFNASTTFNGTTTLGVLTNYNSYPFYGNFGDGSDGNVTIGAGTTTLTRDMYYDNLVINGSLETDGYKVFVKNTVSGSGILFWGIANNGGSSSGSTAGTGGASNASGGTFFFNSPGGNGTNDTSGGNSGGATTTQLGVVGGNGGGGCINGGGGGGSITAPITKFGVFADNTIKGVDWLGNTYGPVYKASNGGGGGSGGCNGGAAGGGGASGGVVYLAAHNWSGTFTIMSRGGNGGNGNTTFNGAGGGGAGGVSIVLYRSKTWSGSYLLTGGSPGTQTNGNAATSGSTGTSYEINVASLLR